MFPDLAPRPRVRAAPVNDASPDRVAGRTLRGRPCELRDCSGDRVAASELRRLLEDLVAAHAFDFGATGAAVGAAGTSTAAIGRPGFAHVQIGERLYRLVVEGRVARLERF